MKARDFNVVVAVADPEARTAVVSALDPVGVRLQIAPANPVALAASAAHDLDCIVLDEGLAGGAEPAALAALWNRGRSVPVILIGDHAARAGSVDTIERGDLDSEIGAR